MYPIQKQRRKLTFDASKDIMTKRPAQIFFTEAIAKAIPEAVPLSTGHRTSGALYVIRNPTLHRH